MRGVENAAPYERTENRGQGVGNGLDRSANQP